MKAQELTSPVRINDGKCVKCATCYHICPFEAVIWSGTTFRIDVTKCQVCGLCASLCPTLAIETAYYNLNSLEAYLAEQRKLTGASHLVIMCRSSSPQEDVPEFLNEAGDFVSLRVPCVGRLPLLFYLKALEMGFERLTVIQCDENFCRTQKGSEISIHRLEELGKFLSQIRYPHDRVTLIKNSLRVVYSPTECVGCGKCEFACPYKAVKLQQLATPRVEAEICRGCGACALICPHLAIEIEGFEYERLSSLIQSYGAKVEQLKAQETSPVVLVFACQWAVFPPLDRREGLLGEMALLVEIPCFNKLDPLFVLQAFRSGFDGVLAVVCPDEDCKSGEGRGVAEENLAALRLTLKKLGLGGRFEVYKTSPRYIGDFEAKLESFLARISSLKKSEARHE